MNININLSSEPFRRDRPWVVGMTTLGILLLFTLGLLIYTALNTRDVDREARAEVELARVQLATFDKEVGRLQQILTRPENAEVIERSVFLNQLLLRKGISWTRIFSDLEKVLPFNVRLVQIRPAITAQNEVFLEMVVASQTSEPFITLLTNLQTSSEFGAAHWANLLPPSQTEPLYRYRITVNYTQKL